MTTISMKTFEESIQTKSMIQLDADVVEMFTNS